MLDNGTCAQVLSRMRTIRKSIVQPDVPYSSLHCPTHLNRWPQDRRHKIGPPSPQRSTLTCGSNGLESWCRKQVRRWQRLKRNLTRFFIRRSGLRKDHRAWEFCFRTEGILWTASSKKISLSQLPTGHSWCYRQRTRQCYWGWAKRKIEYPGTK